jgi:putative transposase
LVLDLSELGGKVRRSSPPGPKGKHSHDRTAVRHGTEPDSVTLGGRRVPVRRPRVRTIVSNEQPAREVPLESYEAVSSTDLLAQGIVARMLAGISTRRYPVALEPVGDQVEQAATSTSRSAVSPAASPAGGPVPPHRCARAWRRR